MTDIPARAAPFPRIDVRHNLPIDENGRLTRRMAGELYGIPDWDTRPALTAFGGTQTGHDPIFVEAAEEFGRRLNAKGVRGITGGAPDNKALGVMTALSEYNDNLIGISPDTFADLKGINSGLSPRAINLVTFDFYTRKTLMFILTDAFAVWGGGIGTIEEAIEAEVIAPKSKIPKWRHYFNHGGIWDPIQAQFTVLKDIGLVRRENDGAATRTFSPNLDILWGHVERRLNERSSVAITEEQIPGKIKPGMHLQQILHLNPHWVPDQIAAFSGDRPRVGIVASGNISMDANVNQLNNRSLTNDFWRQAIALGEDLGKRKAVVVLSGDSGGLRGAIAGAALDAGGSVIWVQKHSQQKKAVDVKISDRELIFTVSREFEKAQLFDYISQASGFIACGMNTLDRVFEIVTREQTGFGGASAYRYIIGDDVVLPDRHRIPTIGYNTGGIWSDIMRQMHTCRDRGFVREKDLGLFGFVDPKDSLAGALIASAQSTYDPLKYIRTVVPRPAP